MAATVIVIISNGILNNPSIPNTLKAVKRLGAIPINIILKERKITKNIKAITANTKDKELICDENKDCNILLYKTAKPVIL